MDEERWQESLTAMLGEITRSVTALDRRMARLEGGLSVVGVVITVVLTLYVSGHLHL